MFLILTTIDLARNSKLYWVDRKHMAEVAKINCNMACYNVQIVRTINGLHVLVRLNVSTKRQQKMNQHIFDSNYVYCYVIYSEIIKLFFLLIMRYSFIANNFLRLFITFIYDRNCQFRSLSFNCLKKIFISLLLI